MASADQKPLWQSLLGLEPLATARMWFSLNGLESYDEVRQRHLRAGLLTGIVVSVLVQLDADMPWQGRVVLVVAIGLCVLCFWLLRRGVPIIWLGRLASAGWVAQLLSFATLELERGWPIALSALPLLVTYGILVGGRLAALICFVPSVLLVGGYYLRPGAAIPPFLTIQLTNWSAATLMTLVLFDRLSRTLHEGASELHEASAVLETTQRTRESLAATLSERVGRTLEQLAHALKSDPDEAAQLSSQLASTLADVRSHVPKEPRLLDVTLGERLVRLKTGLIDVMFGTILILSLVGLVRVIVGDPSESRGRLMMQVLPVLATGVVWLVRRQWRVWLMLGNVIVFALLLPGFLWQWYERASIAPPSLAVVMTASLVDTIALSPVVGWLVLAEFVAVSLIALAQHPGISWTVPVTLALAAGALCWIVANWPRDLLTLLYRRHAESVTSIRQQRRLVATLFHDLANPMVAVVAWAEDHREGSATLEDRATAGEMVARMQAILDSANREQLQVIETTVGRLLDPLVVMFRERLLQKQIRLSVAFDSRALVRCDEALMRDSVLANLLSNAVKFSPPGSTIEFSLEETQDGVVIHLADRGPGLPDDVRRALSTHQRATSRQGSGGEPGSGYGLLLAHEYVAAMGGTLTLTTRDGGGLRASVALPSPKHVPPVSRLAATEA